MLWNRQNHTDENCGLPEDADFAEIYLEGAPDAVKETAAPQKLESPDSTVWETRRLFFKMRRLGDRGRLFDRFYTVRRADTFCKQAELLADFEDNYAEHAEFSQYFPEYQTMSYEQLRTYFTWRSEVRRGRVRPTSLSYVFLYLYELINRIGVRDCRDGLEKLLFLWNDYRVFEPKLDRYLVGWVKDYYIVNDFSVPFDELVQQNKLLRQFYPPADAVSYFDRYAALSRYKTEKSKFYSAERAPALRGCFDRVVRELDMWMGEAGLCFDDLIHSRQQGAVWTPFREALYCPPPYRRGAEKTVRLSASEIYWYQAGQWLSARNGVCRETGRQAITYILRRIEQFYRKTDGFPYQIKADRTKLDLTELSGLPGGSASFFTRIDAAIRAYYQASQRKTVTVDPLRLEHIRADALRTQEKLLAGSQREAEPEPPVPVSAPPESGPEPADTSSGDVWTRFAGSLKEEERDVLRLLLRGVSPDELHAFARSRRIMLEVLVDSLNQKALDTVEDNLVELSDTAALLEDYRNDLERVIAVETE